MESLIGVRTLARQTSTFKCRSSKNYISYILCARSGRKKQRSSSLKSSTQKFLITCFIMKTSQYLTIATLCSSFANCFPQGFNPSRRSNAVLASTPEDPEYYVVVKARTITIGDTTTTIKGFTIGNPGETGPYTTFSAADDRLPDPTDAPIATSVQSRKAHKTTCKILYIYSAISRT